MLIAQINDYIMMTPSAPSLYDFVCHQAQHFCSRGCGYHFYLLSRLHYTLHGWLHCHTFQLSRFWNPSCFWGLKVGRCAHCALVLLAVVTLKNTESIDWGKLSVATLISHCHGVWTQRSIVQCCSRATILNAAPLHQSIYFRSIFFFFSLRKDVLKVHHGS